MYKILKPIILRFLSTTGAKRLIIDLLRVICQQSSNTLDDRAVDMLEQRMRVTYKNLAKAGLM